MAMVDLAQTLNIADLIDLPLLLKTILLINNFHKGLDTIVQVFFCPEIGGFNTAFQPDHLTPVWFHEIRGTSRHTTVAWRILWPGGDFERP